MNVKYFQKLESTNLTARELIKKGEAEHGLVIAADEQTAGRGREGKSFFSPKGGLYMSIVLQHENNRQNNINKTTIITALAGICVCQAIEKFSQKKPMIKWVNDIFIDGLKVCGILTEGVCDKYILGIGVNFSTQYFNEELTKLACGIGENADKNGFMKFLVSRILENSMSDAEILNEYRSRLIGIGKTVEVGEIRGVMEGINDEGALVLKVDDKQKIVYAGSLRFLLNS